MTDTTIIVDQFNAAFLERAPEKFVDLIADDCVMEGTGPAPDGNRWTGYDECLAGWQGLVADPAIQFAVEHVDVDGHRAVIRWRITGTENYRGVNLMRIRDGKSSRHSGTASGRSRQGRAATAGGERHVHGDPRTSSSGSDSPTRRRQNGSAPMVIVAGHVTVEPHRRESYRAGRVARSWVIR